MTLAKVKCPMCDSIIEFETTETDNIMQNKTVTCSQCETQFLAAFKGDKHKDVTKKKTKD